MGEKSGSDTRIKRAVIGALREQDLSGFELWQWLGPVPSANGETSEAMVFPTLYSLEEERLIEGKWREGEETRRRYRITTTGLVIADREGWGPIAFERFGATRYGTREGATHITEGPDAVGDEGGDWHWGSPTTGTAGGKADSGAAALGETASGEVPGSARPAQAAASAASAASSAAEDYLDSLQAALRVSPTYCSDVCHEVGDYITDATARLTALGNTPNATAEVLAALGKPAELAGGINDAQLSEARLRRGMSWASAVATLTFVVSFAIVFDAMAYLTPLVTGVISGILGFVGMHMYAPPTPQWDSQMIALGLCVAAFLVPAEACPSWPIVRGSPSGSSGAHGRSPAASRS